MISENKFFEGNSHYALSDAITCLSYFQAKPEYRDELIKELMKLVAPTRAESGCIQYDLVLDNENPNFLTLVEKFANMKVFDEHEKQPYIQRFLTEFMEKYCEKVTWREGREIKKCP